MELMGEYGDHLSSGHVIWFQPDNFGSEVHTLHTPYQDLKNDKQACPSTISSLGLPPPF